MAATSSPAAPAAPAIFTRSGLWLGARLAIPAVAPSIVFGMAFGTVAIQKGLPFGEATLMSGIVLAGASQFVVVEMWTEPMLLSALVAAVVVSAVVNLRFFLMSASLRPWLGGLRAWQVYPALAMMTDPGWLLSMRYNSEGGRDGGVFFGSGLVLWGFWVVSTIAGALLGSLVTDPAAFGIDLVLPCFFAVMLVPMWKGSLKAVPWAIAGAVALLTAQLVDGWWYIIVGSLAGGISAAFIDDSRA